MSHRKKAPLEWLDLGKISEVRTTVEQRLPDLPPELLRFTETIDERDARRAEWWGRWGRPR